jgi:hypothetical protein
MPRTSPIRSARRAPTVHPHEPGGRRGPVRAGRRGHAVDIVYDLDGFDDDGNPTRFADLYGLGANPRSL